MKKISLLIMACLCSLCVMAQQKLPCTVADINTALSEYDKKVLSTSQYLLMDINADGVKDIIVRDSDLPSASYAVLIVKDGKLEVENFAYDGYDMLGYANGGFSFYQHDDHMGMEGRTWATNFSRYKNGKEVMKGGHSVTMSMPDSDSDDYESEEYCEINDKQVSRAEYDKIVPEIQWFSNIKTGWRMVRNNQQAIRYSDEIYDIYDGEIGDYPVTLCFDKGKHDGFYFYKSRPENKFTLKCVDSSTVDGEDIIEVNEYDPEGNNTGTFKGKYRKGSSFTGTFTTDAGKSYDFSLYSKF